MTIFGTKDFLKIASERTGFRRESYIESKIPDSAANCTIIPFFGDFRHQFILSSFVLHRYVTQVVNSRYYIMCSWSGCGSLFPYVNEFWTIKDNLELSILFGKTVGMGNSSQQYADLVRNLRQYFEDVLDVERLCEYYKDGFTRKFLESFGGKFIYKTPEITSSVSDKLLKQLNNVSGKKVFIYPSLHGKNFIRKREGDFRVSKNFWIDLCTTCLEQGLVPVVYQNYGTYDLSPHFADKCFYFNENNMSYVLSVLRATHCAIDVFMDTRDLALWAKIPFVACEDRNGYFYLKKYEVDNLCAKNVFHKYIYTLPSIIEGGKWHDLIKNIVSKSKDLISTVDYNSLPSSLESNEVLSYNDIRLKNKVVNKKCVGPLKKRK